MTDLKLDGKLTADASDALADHARALYDKLGLHRVGIVEFRSVERVTPAPGEDKAAAVKLRITCLEVATSDEQEDAVREAQRALHLQRTSRGTLDAAGQIELTPYTLENTGNRLNAIEAARLKTALDFWQGEIRRVIATPDLRDGEIRHELDRIATGLDRALHPAREEETTDA